LRTSTFFNPTTVCTKLKNYDYDHDNEDEKLQSEITKSMNIMQTMLAVFTLGKYESVNSTKHTPQG